MKIKCPIAFSLILPEIEDPCDYLIFYLVFYAKLLATKLVSKLHGHSKKPNSVLHAEVEWHYPGRQDTVNAKSIKIRCRHFEFNLCILSCTSLIDPFARIAYSNLFRELCDKCGSKPKAGAYAPVQVRGSFKNA